MVDEGKGKKRRGRSTKAATAASSSRQRTLKDMFGVSSKASKSDVSESQLVPEAVIELSDSEPEIIATQPSTPPETEGSAMVSGLSSLSSLTNEGISSTTRQAAPEPEPPKKLFPIFEKRITRSSTRQQKQDEVTANSDVTKEVVLEISSSEHDTSSFERPRSPSIQIQEPFPKSFTAGSNRNAPIISEPTSPKVKLTRLTPRPAKPVYSIFNHPARAVASTSKSTTAVPVPPPSKENQAEYTWISLSAVSAQFSLRDKAKAKELEIPLEEVPLRRLLPTPSGFNCLPLVPAIRSLQSIDIHDCINTIPLAHHSIPSVVRLLQVAEDGTHLDPSSLNEQWTERWRPQEADEVIGNEQHALYLRDWLQALRLHSETLRTANTAPSKKAQKRKKRKGKNKKPDVVRHVKKRRRDGHGDDFFAPDDFTGSEDELDALDAQSSDSDDIGFCREMDARINGSTLSTDISRGSSPGLAAVDEDSVCFTYKPARFGRQISNTILLTGPSGSGKTAAVYACAKELGWEVFEVFPGIGERSGTELNKLIGDVGKNHTVKVHQSPKSNAKAAFFQKQAAPPPKRNTNAKRVDDSDDELDLLKSSPGPQEATDKPIDVVGDPTPEQVLEPMEPSVNQSVILIEEADILYQTDTNFWPALVNIIKHCRRPVVLTCNDMSLIPCDDLPLQATLDFRACPAQLTASYLQALCLAEKRPVAREDLLHALGGSVSDLRRAVQHLQVWVDSSQQPLTVQETEAVEEPQSFPESSPFTWSEKTSSPGPASPDGAGGAEEARALRQVEKQHELHSFVDAWLARGSSALPHSFFEDDPFPSPDDQLGYTVLYSDTDADHIPVSPYYVQDTQLAQDVLDSLRQLEDTGVPLPEDDPNSGRTAYLTQIPPLLRPFHSRILPATDPSLHLDYAPWLRYMVNVEEEQRAVLASTELPGSQRRRTRNSQKNEESWLALEAKDRRVLASSGFST